jgi:hypothetical protein
MAIQYAQLTTYMYVWQKRPERIPSLVVAQARSLLTSFLLVCRVLRPFETADVSSRAFSLVKHIPTWMPGAGFKRHALRTRIKVRNMHDTPYEMVRTAMVSRGSPINTRSLIPYQGGRHSHSFVHIETYIGQLGCWTVTCPRRRGHQGDSRNVVWR